MTKEDAVTAITARGEAAGYRVVKSAGCVLYLGKPIEDLQPCVAVYISGLEEAKSPEAIIDGRVRHAIASLEALVAKGPLPKGEAA